MNPLLLAGGSGLATLIGALMSKDQNPTIDPAMLKRLFGPGEISDETMQFFRLLANSPVFSQMMNSAAIQGSRMSNEASATFAKNGAFTPINAFLAAAGRGYGANIQRSGQANLFLDALRAATQNVGARQEAFVGSQLHRQDMPTWNRMIGSSLLNTGAYGFENLLTPKKVIANG